MPFDGIVTKHIIHELNQAIIGGKINKVYEPNKNELLFGIYSNGINYALNVCIDSQNLRLCLTTHSKPNPLNAPNFCMLLRKHLIGNRIVSIESLDLERIIFIELEGYNELNDLVRKKLVIELMGKHSNVLLLNKNNMIIDTLRHISSTYRELLPAREYLLPEFKKNSFLEIENFEDFYNIIQNNYVNSVSDTISNYFTGISKTFIKYILKKLNIIDSTITQSDIEKVYHYMKNIITHLFTESISCILISDNNKEDFILDISTSSSILEDNFFIDDFYYQKEGKIEFISYRNTVLKIIFDTLKKYEKKLNNINTKLKECEKMNQYKLYGELITSNLYKIPNHNLTFIVLENYYDNNREIQIPLDESLSPSLNAKKFFKKYNKLKNTLEIVTKQKQETIKDLDYLQSIIFSLENAQSIYDINVIYNEIKESSIFKDRSFSIPNSKTTNNKKQKLLKEKKDISFGEPIKLNLEGYHILIGKNNKQNDYLTLRFANKEDLWFHTKEVHGSHVILQTDHNEIPDDILIQCAMLAAKHSKAKDSSNVAVDYTKIKYVKKPNGSKPGMVVYTNQKTIQVNPK